MAHEGYHEPVEELTDETRDMHRAIVSLMEELEAVDWYQQRVDAARDPELKRILAHNRDEEKEHAAMVLEWLRRRDPSLDEQLRTYLFSQGEITTLEEAAMGRNGGTGGSIAQATSGDGSLGIGSLKNTNP